MFRPLRPSGIIMITLAVGLLFGCSRPRQQPLPIPRPPAKPFLDLKLPSDYGPSRPGDRIAFANQYSENGTPNMEICVMAAPDWRVTRLTHNPADDTHPTWSPDGSKIAFQTNRDGNFEIYVMNADGTNPVNLTRSAANDTHPAWSPDGTKIVFTRRRDRRSQLYVMNADGSNQKPLTPSRRKCMEGVWSPDGEHLAFLSIPRGENASEIYVMNADGTHWRRLTYNKVPDVAPAWSPDGSKIAFQGLPQDRDFEICVINADGTGEPVNLTRHAALDESPAWSPDGSQIAFCRRDPDAEPPVNDILVMNADGTSQVNLTRSAGRPDIHHPADPAWWGSPNPHPSAGLAVSFCPSNLLKPLLTARGG